MYLHPGSGLNMMDKVSKFSTLHNLGFDKPRENSSGVSRNTKEYVRIVYYSMGCI